MTRVAVAMSGGVDSTVAALLLKRQGYRLVGVFMRNWDERDENGHCTSDADLQEVERVCEHIGIPCRHVNFVKEYWNEVFSHFLQDYQSGRTPNPDILCNQRIKFNSFFQHAVNSLEVDAIATGHYARVQRTESGLAKLLQSVDKFKDQTYFLCNIPQLVLQRTLFPVGALMKHEVKQIATEAGLQRTANRKESMGLCFIGKRNFAKFIHEYLEEKQGDFITLEGKRIGQHHGHHFFTTGQRAKIGGQLAAMFVARKDARNNTVTVVEGRHHPALFCHSFTASSPHWISGTMPEAISRGQPLECLVRQRHQHSLKWCRVEILPNTSATSKQDRQARTYLKVKSKEPLRAVTPGQFAVFYQDEECLGGSCIEEPELGLVSFPGLRVMESLGTRLS